MLRSAAGRAVRPAFGSGLAGCVHLTIGDYAALFGMQIEWLRCHGGAAIEGGTGMAPKSRNGIEEGSEERVRKPSHKRGTAAAHAKKLAARALHEQRLQRRREKRVMIESRTPPAE